MILANQVWLYNCFLRWFWSIRFDVTIVSSGNNCKVKPDWLEQTYCPMKMLYAIGCRRQVIVRATLLGTWQERTSQSHYKLTPGRPAMFPSTHPLLQSVSKGAIGTIFLRLLVCHGRGSNPQPSVPQTDTLPLRHHHQSHSNNTRIGCCAEHMCHLPKIFHKIGITQNVLKVNLWLPLMLFLLYRYVCLWS